MKNLLRSRQVHLDFHTSGDIAGIARTRRYPLMLDGNTVIVPEINGYAIIELQV